MSQQLINRSADLKRLQVEGYEVEVIGGYLLIRQLPYVNSTQEVKRGILICPLTLANNVAQYGNDHVIYFAGEMPCNKDGTPITAIQHGNVLQQHYPGMSSNFSFSNKPPQGYRDYYEKVVTYATIISSPASALDPTATAKTFKVVSSSDEHSVFNYVDSNSTRANISMLNEKLKKQKIAIVGVGGTGSYILDMVSKTHVPEIHLFDGDEFLQHNAFRAPGAASSTDIDGMKKKVEYFSTIYSQMRGGIIPHPYPVTESKLHELDLMDFVFISIDNDTARRMIIPYLIKQKIKFIDCGLGINVVDEYLIGTVRVTACTPQMTNHLSNRLSFEEDRDNAYSTNIQIAELNCLNAVMAVIKWKKLSGFYQDLKEEHHSTYSLNVSQLLNEDAAA